MSLTYMRVVTGLGIAVLTAAGALGDRPATSQKVWFDASGAHLETFSDYAPTPPNGGPTLRGPGIVWEHAHPDSLIESVAVLDELDSAWAGYNINASTARAFQTTGDGVPTLEFFADGFPARVYVASAETSSLTVVAITDPGGGLAPAQFLAFRHEQGTIPVWTWTADETYDDFQYYGFDVSDDGSRVAAAVYPSNVNTGLVVILDGTNGTELARRTFPGWVTSVELTATGHRAAVSYLGTVEVVETTAGLPNLCTFAAGSGPADARISRDGAVAAAGGGFCRAMRESPEGWVETYFGFDSGHWFGQSVALSGDGSRLLAASWGFSTQDHILRVVDLTTGLETARLVLSGGDPDLQNSLRRAAMSADGRVLALASWGGNDPARPEVQVYDDMLSLIGAIDLPGSAYALDLSADGHHLGVGTKAVHANTMGRGGSFISYAVPTSNVGDLDHDGDVDLADLAILLSCFAEEACGDVDGDGTTDLADLALLLANFGS